MSSHVFELDNKDVILHMPNVKYDYVENCIDFEITILSVKEYDEEGDVVREAKGEKEAVHLLTVDELLALDEHVAEIGWKLHSEGKSIRV